MLFYLAAYNHIVDNSYNVKSPNTDSETEGRTSAAGFRWLILDCSWSHSDWIGVPGDTWAKAQRERGLQPHRSIPFCLLFPGTPPAVWAESPRSSG